MSLSRLSTVSVCFPSLSQVYSGPLSATDEMEESVSALHLPDVAVGLSVLSVEADVRPGSVEDDEELQDLLSDLSADDV